mmetsp:Transcript_7789/g.10378  ORF Transcript_7789/g.10378 Transcript_7789/m.10378 type:complete len:111 (-) Transcript_7789:527-859(-)
MCFFLLSLISIMIEEAKKSHASSSVRSSLDVSEVGSGVMAPEILMEREEKRRRRKQEGKAKTDAEVQAAINLLKKANSTILTYEDKIAKLLKENKEMERKLENVTSKKTN